MRTYLITYDLASPARHTLSGAIMQLGDVLGPAARDHMVRAVGGTPRCAGAAAQGISTARTAC